MQEIQVDFAPKRNVVTISPHSFSLLKELYNDQNFDWKRLTKQFKEDQYYKRYKIQWFRRVSDIETKDPLRSILARFKFYTACGV